MASIRGLKDINVVIDGYPLEGLQEFDLSRDVIDVGLSWYGTESVKVAGLTHITIRTTHGTEITFTPDDQKTVQEGNVTTIYIYGVLRKMFPAMFADRDLLPWQLAYLVAFDHPKVAKYKYFRDHSLFTGAIARSFQVGYEHGEKAGEEYGKAAGIKEGFDKATEKASRKRKRY